MPLWFRAYNEAIDDRKFKHIANKLGVPKIQVLGAWWVLLALANNGTDRGRLLVDETTILTRRDIIAEISEGMTETQAFALFNEFLIRDLVRVDGDTGAHYVTQFSRRNFVSDDSTKRVQRYREKKKCEDRVSGNSGVTADETLQEPTESESDTESESEQQRTESQQQTTGGGAVVAATLEGLHELGITASTDAELVGQFAGAGSLDVLVPWAKRWIDHFRRDKDSKNPIGRAIAQLRSGIPPPPAEDDWRRFLCKACEAHPCTCGEVKA